MTYEQEVVACDQCDADHEFVKLENNMMILRIMHDDDCPVLAAHEGKKRRK